MTVELKLPIPRGTATGSTGYRTNQGMRRNVFVKNHSDFLKHFPAFKRKYPRVSHKYVFEGREMPEKDIIEILKLRKKQAELNRQAKQLNAIEMKLLANGPRRSARTRTVSTRLGAPKSVLSKQIKAGTAKRMPSLPEPPRRRRKQLNPRRSFL